MKLLPVLDHLKTRHTLKQFMTFSGVGAIGTMGHYATLIVLVQIWGVAPIYASTAGFAVGAIINYFLNYWYTFRSKKRHAEAMVKFFSVAVLGTGINGLIMFLGTELVHIHYLLVQLFATGIIVFLTFILNKLWTFAHHRSSFD